MGKSGFLWEAGFIWKKCGPPVLTLIIPLILSVVFLWEGTELPRGSLKNAPPPPKWKQCRALFVVLLMGAYWVSECLPLPMTALCPIFLLPLLEIIDTDSVAGCYLNQSVLLLMAGCIVAQAFEYSNLHTRIALKVTCIVGARVPVLLAGVMGTAMFLSMWMNNTSTTSMMVPILAVIMAEFKTGARETAKAAVAKEKEAAALQETALQEAPLQEAATDAPSDELPARKSDVKKISDAKRLSTELLIEAIINKSLKEARDINIMFLLGAAWASNIGGTGIITGTATNLIAIGEANKRRTKVNSGETRTINRAKCAEFLDITFINWVGFNIVPMIISTVFTWAILLLWFKGMPRFMKFKKRTPQEKLLALEHKKVTKNIEKAIIAKYNQLGPITLHEILVLVIFIALATLWITSEMGKFGWYQLFTAKDVNGETKRYPNSAVPALLMCLFLFVLPKDAKYYKDFANGGLAHGLKDPVLPWSEVEAKVPWGPLILIGGGTALGDGMRESGLSTAIGVFLQHNDTLAKLPKEGYLAVILVVVALLTSIASNTATAAILSPVLMELSFKKNIHPMYLLLPATASASYAFVLPISTPPNAIVLDKSDMTQKEMALPGLIVTFATNFVLFAMVHSYCELIFKFQDYKNECGSPV